MPDSTQPAEPHTESTEKESIRKSQEEFVGDEATPSRDRSETEEDRGSQSSDRAVEDASLSNLAENAVGTEEEDDADDMEDGEEDLDEDDPEGSEEEDLEETAEDDEFTEDEAENAPGEAHALVVA